MSKHLGPLPVEVIEPESAKFTADLVLVHGLWARAAGWRRFAGYLAHRGWRCLALELGRNGAGGDLAVRRAALHAALAELGGAPIVVGHDLGALLALHCAARARAVVALAPLVGPPFADPAPVLRRAGGWWARWRGAPLRAPGGRWRALYASTDLREPAALLRSLSGAALVVPPLPADVPCAVFAGEADPLLDGGQARALAAHLGAELHALRGTGHAVLNAPRWESHVAAMHRWIIQRLGVDLLALYDEAWEGREKP